MDWRKSSFCNTDAGGLADCVEVRGSDTAVQVRDADGTIANFSRDEFGAFVAGVKAGEYDDLT